MQKLFDILNRLGIWLTSVTDGWTDRKAEPLRYSHVAELRQGDAETIVLTHF